MKVAYVLPISWGGIPHYTAELANAVAKYADVTVIKPKDANDELFSEDIKVINAFKPLSFSREHEIKAFCLENMKNFFSYRNIRRINELKPDIIHFPGIYPHTSFFTYLYKLSTKYPIIYTIHATYDPSFTVSQRRRGFFAALLGGISDYLKTIVKPDRIIVHTHENKSALIKEGVGPEKIIVIPHGAYTFFKKYSRDEIESDENYVLYFGYIIKNKGVEYLIKAVPIISKEISDINVTCIAKAVSDTPGQVPFYVSSTHGGIHTLKPFHPTHRLTMTVDAVRLDETIADMRVDQVTVLKIDVEGADFLALKSFDFRKFHPDVVICEFMDKRSRENFGYTHHDMAAYMNNFDYATFVSEWGAIVEYAREDRLTVPPKFLCCALYPLDHNPIWGNLIFIPNDRKQHFERILPSYLIKLKLSNLVVRALVSIACFVNQRWRCLNHER